MGSTSSNSHNLSTFCFSQHYLEETKQIKSKESSTTLLLLGNFSNIFRWQKLLSFATIQFIILYPRCNTYKLSCFCGFIILQLLFNLLYKVIFPFVWNTLHSSLPNLWTIQLLWSMRVIFKEGQICDKAFKISYRGRGMYFRFFFCWVCILKPEEFRFTQTVVRLPC